MTEQVKTKNRIKASKGLFVSIGLALLILYTVIFLMPLLWAFLVSFKGELDFMSNIFGLPKKWLLSNYSYVFKNMAVPVSGVGDIFIEEMFFNSMCYTLLCTFTHTITPCICAYAVARYRFKFGKFIYGIVIVTMILPTIGNLASEIQVAKTLGFYDTLIGVAIMKGHFLGTNFLIFYAAFRSLPDGFREAAEMDGASQAQIFFRISLPLVKTTIGAIALLSFITYWNDYNTAMIYLPSKPTVAYGLYRFTHSTTNKASFVTVAVAACMTVTIPIFFVFVLFRNKLMGNLTVGGIKG